ncbi:hypothetical protein, partial [uncultured Mitsuokella sp.]|uniref:hypothetical protein n=1 Tax=uncultured Mitsuokella sp. TaxID=453120 RepID=UPI002593E61D
IAKEAMRFYYASKVVKCCEYIMNHIHFLKLKFSAAQKKRAERLSALEILFPFYGSLMVPLFRF